MPVKLQPYSQDATGFYPRLASPMPLYALSFPGIEFKAGSTALINTSVVNVGTQLGLIVTDPTIAVFINFTKHYDFNNLTSSTPFFIYNGDGSPIYIPLYSVGGVITLDYGVKIGEAHFFKKAF